jgi:hypothetical protein
MNAGSGRHAARQRKQLVETMLGERGHRCSVVLARGGRQLIQAIRRQSEAARAVDGVHTVRQPIGRQAQTICPECVGLHHLGAGLDVLPMNLLNGIARR